MTTVGKLLSGAAAIALASTLVASDAWTQAKGDAKADDKKGKNVGARKPDAKQQTSDELLGVAEQLIRYGDQKKDALPLIVAVRIQREAGAQDKDRKKETKGGDGKQATKQGLDMSTKGVLERAKQYAGSRKDLVALADDAAAASARGRTRGPARFTTTVNARTTDVYRETFNGGERAYVAISGDGDTDLDLIVYDENNNLICRADSRSDDEACTWHPRWTGMFRIEVRNLGNVYNRYVIVSN